MQYYDTLHDKELLKLLKAFMRTLGPTHLVIRPLTARLTDHWLNPTLTKAITTAEALGLAETRRCISSTTDIA